MPVDDSGRRRRWDGGGAAPRTPACRSRTSAPPQAPRPLQSASRLRPPGPCRRSSHPAHAPRSSPHRQAGSSRGSRTGPSGSDAVSQPGRRGGRRPRCARTAAAARSAGAPTLLGRDIGQQPPLHASSVGRLTNAANCGRAKRRERPSMRPSVALDRSRDQMSRCPRCFWALMPARRPAHLTRGAAATYPASTIDSFDVTTLQCVAGRSRGAKIPWQSCKRPPRAERRCDELKRNLRAELRGFAEQATTIEQNGCKAAYLDGPGRDRTCDLGIKSPLLYQLSYRPRRRVYVPTDRAIDRHCAAARR